MLPDRLAFVDLEATSSGSAGAILELGLVLVDGDQVQTWSSLVQPEVDIPEFVQGLTGITPALVADAPRFEDLAQPLLQMLEGRLFIAHNVSFDYGLLKQSFAGLGMAYESDRLCTVRLSRRLFPEERRHKLSSLIERHGLTAGDRHRALSDAWVLWQFWQWIQVNRPEDWSREASQLIRSGPQGTRPKEA